MGCFQASHAITDWDFAKPKKKLGEKKTDTGIVFWSRTIGAVERKGLPELPRPKDSEEFAKAMGFRGVQYGKWADDAEREWHVTNAYWGLHDLASVLGVPAKELGINGRMALAFGARGKGGKRAAAAHYEPGQRVINLTKMQGNGTLAHEFAHFMDHAMFMAYNPTVGKAKYVSTDGFGNVGYGDIEARKGAVEINTAMKELMQTIKYDDSPERRAERETKREAALKELEAARAETYKLQPQVDAAREAVHPLLEEKSMAIGDEAWTKDIVERMQPLEAKLEALQVQQREVQRKLSTAERTYHENRATVVQSDFYRQAKGLDDTEGRKQAYYAKDLELFARVFESYVEDKLHEKGGRSSYLVDGTRHAGNPSPDTPEIKPDAPVPTAGYRSTNPRIDLGCYIPVADPHRGRTNVAMDKLVEAMRKNQQFRKAMGGEAWLDSLLKGPQLVVS